MIVEAGSLFSSPSATRIAPVSSIVLSMGVPSRSLKRYFVSQIVWATGGRNSSASGSVAASMMDAPWLSGLGPAPLQCA